MSLRVSVESVILYEGKILLVKRSPHSEIAPNVWNVPAGKVKLLETTEEAVVRETKEETGIQVNVVKLLAESAFKLQAKEEYRNMFTYLVTPSADTTVALNYEHTEFAWVNQTELESERFDSLMPRLKEILKKAWG